MIDRNDYYSGGYFLVRGDKPDWPQLKIDWPLEDVISLSPCFCPKLEVNWGWIPGDAEAVQKFGIPENLLDEFKKWCSKSVDIEYPSSFASPKAARRFIQQFLPDTRNLYLIGVGLPKEREAENWNETSDGESIGLEKLIEEHLPLEPGGNILGFEVISFWYCTFRHSWLCNYIQADIKKSFGFYPNPSGLIDRYEDAKKVYEWIAEDPWSRGEPEEGNYSVWLLVSYPLVEAHS